ncbi:MAG: CheY-like chemotaxis protein, partial [Pirellulaceae bacterium]
EGGVRLDVTTVDDDIHRLQFIVTDTGIGIDPGKLNSIFEPFVQADSSVTREFGGTGLGLAISKRIAEALGGSLRAESVKGQGSVFTIEIEIGEIDDQLQSIEGPDSQQESNPVADVAATKADTHNATPRRILVVDDAPANVRLLKVILTKSGAHVSTAENGKVAVEMATTQDFDLILMDMQMPVMDGYTATKRLRQAGLDTPIIALTAHAMKGDEAKCIATGCTGYLTKPIDHQLLLKSVKECLSHSQLPSGGELDAETAKALRQSPSNAEPDRIFSTLPTDDPLFQEIIDEFIDYIAETSKEMEAAFDARDIDRLATLSHTLKGTGGTAGFAAITAPATEINDLAKAERIDEIGPAMARLAEVVRQIVPAKQDDAKQDAALNDASEITS